MIIYKDCVKKDELEICSMCGGTGISPYDKTRYCGKCNGFKLMHHLNFDLQIPYKNENDRKEKVIALFEGIEKIRSKG